MTIRKLAAGFLALSVLAGCSSASSTSDASSAAGEKELKTKAVGTGATLHEIGDTIDEDGILYTLETVNPGAESDYYVPESGNQLYRCFMEIENTSDEPFSFIAIDWLMRIPGGYAPMPLEIRLQDYSVLTDVKLNPGESVSGYLVFEASPDTEMVLYPPTRDLITGNDAWLIQSYDD